MESIAPHPYRSNRPTEGTYSRFYKSTNTYSESIAASITQNCRSRSILTAPLPADTPATSRDRASPSGRFNFAYETKYLSSEKLN